MNKSIEDMWIENDVKIELLAKKFKKLKEEYYRNHPEADYLSMERHVSSLINGETDKIVREQVKIVSSALSNLS